MHFIFGSCGRVDGSECAPIVASVEPRYGRTDASILPGTCALYGCGQDPRRTTRRAILSGFIVNAGRLRALGAEGETDVDLLVSAYDRLGAAAFDLVEGHFSIALWDSAAKALVLVRDRMGVYPLYLARIGNTHFFSSDYKSLLTLEELPLVPDARTIGFFHHSGWLPRGKSFLENVASVVAGAVTVVANGECRVVRTLPVPIDDEMEYDLARNVEQVGQELRAAVDAYWPSGQVVGATLSNGIDSSHLMAELARQCHERGATLHSFTVGYGETDPEIVGARETTAYLGTIHHEVFVRPQDLATLWPEAIWHLEDPVGRDQYPCVMALAKAARPHVDTLFYANGPDSVYGGLHDHQCLMYANQRPGLRSAIEDVLTYQRSGTPARDGRGSRAIRRFGEPALPRPVLPLPKGTELTERIVLPESVHAYLLGEIDEYDSHFGKKHQLMRSAAQMNMRIPLYTNAILRLSSRIPDEHKVTLQENKIVWRRAAGALLPPQICRRPKGIQHLNYGVEYSDVIDDYARRVLTPSAVATRGLMPKDVLERLLRRPGGRAYGPKHLYRIWYAISTELWCQIFLDNRGRGWTPIGDAS